MTRVELGDWEAMRQWAAPIRFAVFVDEQKVPADIEIDDWDAASVHAVAFDDAAAAIGTGRLLPDGHIGRMAVTRVARGSGVGSALLRVLMEEARRRGHREAVLSAQTHAVAFYRRHGYQIAGAEYMDAGIPHVDMRCAL
ncbi:MAG TPA: GNAT family N-acetyltransferase [Burkholderiaceae bacterium]|nr:GNAT family N-acetyltransferase [Burkholderiaceae bacterium]